MSAPTARECYGHAAELLRSLQDVTDMDVVAVKIDISDRWRWLGEAMAGPRVDWSPMSTDSRIERARQWDHDRRTPIGFGGAL